MLNQKIFGNIPAVTVLALTMVFQCLHMILPTTFWSVFRVSAPLVFVFFGLCLFLSFPFGLVFFGLCPFGLRRKLSKNVSVLVFEENFLKMMLICPFWSSVINFFKNKFTKLILTRILIITYYLTIIQISNSMFSDEFRQRKMSFTLAPVLSIL